MCFFRPSLIVSSRSWIVLGYERTKSVDGFAKSACPVFLPPPTLVHLQRAAVTGAPQKRTVATIAGCSPLHGRHLLLD